jgi:four helix bundle protein
MQDFRNLLVWKKAHALVLEIYQQTEQFPKSEIYGLTSQIRRAAASIPENIAEGCGKHGDAELVRYLQIAMGSASELEYELILAHDLAYLNQEQYTMLVTQLIEVRKMLNSLIQSLRKPKPIPPNNRTT